MITIPLGWLLSGLLILITAQLIYAFWPLGNTRSFGKILLFTALGFLLGELWALIGLPALQLGDANLFPSLGFVLIFQPLLHKAASEIQGWLKPKTPTVL